MKKFLALLLALCMVFALCACGSEPAADDAADDGAAEDGQSGDIAIDLYSVAMITDYGDITDQSFNQTTYEACKSFCEEYNVDFTYFKPASDSDEDRIAMIESAIDEGFNVIVMPGYAFANAIKATAGEYSDVTFIALDVGAGDLGDDYEVPANLYCAVYQEELCGFMAGYAAVKLGYTKLGFLGGMAVPAVVRYGYGFVQGADKAAVEMGLTDVQINYAYGNQFFGDADITAAMDTWYAGGTEVVFSCGGGIFTSAVDAAVKADGKVIGVDVDQAGIIAAYAAGEDGDPAQYADLTVTSAMKGLAATVKTLLSDVVSASFEGGKIDNLGLVSENPEENYVQIAGSTQFGEGFTAEDYNALVASLFAGEIEVSNDINATAADMATVVAVNDLGNLK